MDYKNVIELWPQVEEVVVKRFKKDKADLKTILFLLGLRELGKVHSNFSKEEKQDLMNLAICRVFSLSEYFAQDGLDNDGWPIWKQTKALPKMSVKEQEVFIKSHIVLFFQQEKLI